MGKVIVPEGEPCYLGGTASKRRGVIDPEAMAAAQYVEDEGKAMPESGTKTETDETDDMGNNMGREFLR